MADLEKRKARAVLHKELVDLLTNCKNDNEYYQRLVWAQEIITNCLADFIADGDDELE